MLIHIILTYLVCSIPFGVLLARACGLGDITKQGSGNTGATNAWRIGGYKIGILTFILDAGKGFLCLHMAQRFQASYSELQILACVAAFAHCYSIFLRFNGGKAVATIFGVLLFLVPNIALIMMIIWLICFAITKNSGLSSIISMLSVTILHVISVGVHGSLYIIFLAALLIISHKNNIRLLRS